ncbi:hypothetical protein NQ317_004270 [Molorchus minor]|uniref:THAP-type domain-containing protein n=1 Tax=Molorchus minor TaxID=1323400 RepID=A0ABQ9K226_9CUCU|nr:hypothetical protein NQ317_004270 [Molorchus minor]
MNSLYYKYCIVPQCKITTIKTPNKLFIYVPNNEQIRKKWLKLARRDDVHSLSTNSRMYFCADHFDDCQWVQSIPARQRNTMYIIVVGNTAQDVKCHVARCPKATVHSRMAK